MHVSQLRHEEAVHLDGDRLEEICHQFGYGDAEAAICAAMEDLAVLLQQAGKMWRGGDMASLEVTARQIAGVAERIGMAGLARVAGDVMTLAGTSDCAGLGQSHGSVALSATVARMRRLGERSLLAIWDRQDLMV